MKKVGECLYRNHLGTYFALVKVNGKQIRKWKKCCRVGIHIELGPDIA